MWEDQFWHEMRRIRKAIDRAFGSDEFSRNEFDNYRYARAGFAEEENEFIISLEIPGIKKEDIHIEIGEDNIIVKAQKKQEIKKEDEKAGRYSYSRQYSGFYRSFRLPDDADLENLDTKYEDGILKITVPKIKNKKRKVIKVK